MAGRKAYEPTEEHIKIVQDLKSKGASDKACYDAISIGKTLFQKFKKTHFGTSIKKGKEIRTQNHYDLAIDALALRLQQRTVKETTTTTRDYQGVEQVETKEVEKVIQPADTLIMFTLVNKGDGAWQSINKTEQKVEVKQLPKLTVNVIEPNESK